MQVVDGILVCSPSDLTGFLSCEHLTELDRRAAQGDARRPERTDPEVEVLTRRGLEHERRYLDQLRADRREIVEITEPDLVAAARATEEALRAGVEVVYQAVFFDGRWHGHADFVQRVDEPSNLGTFGYEVYDTKLARRVKATALLQLLAYAEMLEAIQGRSPVHVHAVLGDMSVRSYTVHDYAPYLRALRRRFEAARGKEIYPEPCEHCAVCRWSDVCDARRRTDDHLSIVAGLGRPQATKLRAIGVSMVAELAVASTGPPRMGSQTFERLRHQAELQVAQRSTSVVSYELLPPEPLRGLALLPEPSSGDIAFDIEGDPYEGDEGLEYLLGVSEPDGTYTAFWGHDAAGERAAFEGFMDLVMARLRADPGMHVYHYASYEASALKRLAARYATREDDVDRLLRGGVLCDLYQVVRQALRCSQESYSLKKLEPLYMAARDAAIADAGSSIVAYESWLQSGDAAVLSDLEAYNKDDCISTLLLRDWLEARRVDARVNDRPAIRNPEPDDTTARVDQETAELSGRLRARGDELLADVVGWHRREDRPAWWAYYHRMSMTDEELADEPDAIGDLTYEGEDGQVKRSLLHRYRFDPQQEHKFSVGKKPVDPATGKPAGEIMSIDNLEGIVVLKRGLSSTAPHPRSIIAPGPIDSGVLRRALHRAAEAPSRVVRCLLDRTEDRSVLLPVQGPPGTGKTYTGARMVAESARAGKRVGVCATSHKAITNFVDAIADAAPDVRILQLGEAGSNAASVTQAKDNAEVESDTDHQVIAGTPWLFARDSVQVDELFIDEAGQMSLANVIAISQGCDRLVLLGDPNQLAQPSQGVHPPGAGVSALEHLLGDAETLPEDRGMFLSVTYRLHPSICSYISDVFYEGRLTSDDACATQSVDGSSGLRIRFSVHEGNRAASTAEAEDVAQVFDDLVARSWTDFAGVTRPMTMDDVLVVAPYNAHVARLKSRLPAGARVGTVDRFQGQEAAAVILSMATSSPEDMPRNAEFLYSRNRVNVALSRARCLSVVVMSEKLLHLRARTPEQMRLVAALARFVEIASPI